MYVPLRCRSLRGVRLDGHERGARGLALIYSAVFALCISYTIWYAGVRQLGSARTSVYSNFVPIVAMLTPSSSCTSRCVRKIAGAAPLGAWPSRKASPRCRCRPCSGAALALHARCEQASKIGSVLAPAPCSLNCTAPGTRALGPRWHAPPGTIAAGRETRTTIRSTPSGSGPSLAKSFREQLMRDLHREVCRRGISRSRSGSSRSSASARGGCIHYANPLIWIPLALVQGFTVFNFTVMLHEVVHHTVFERPHPAAERALALLYATPSGISASQFTRWHLDHHAELGSDEDDPKRHHLSPKINARWYKLLYATPALFPIYFRAARRESSTYPAGSAAHDRPRALAVDGIPPVGARAALVLLRRRRGAAHQHHPGVLRLPDRVHAQPARPALRHRSRPTRRSGAR